MTTACHLGGMIGLEKRPFGTTGAQFPLLSFGAQRIVDEHHCTEEEAIQIVNRAIDEGITYFDTVTKLFERTIRGAFG
ncbi:hypothetical protein D3C85_1415460 [compost metagenome]